jgi:hypothetical protein
VALGVMDLSQQARKTLRVITPMRPIGLLPDVSFISAIHAAIVDFIHRKVKLFTVVFAEYKQINLRRLKAANPPKKLESNNHQVSLPTLFGLERREKKKAQKYKGQNIKYTHVNLRTTHETGSGLNTVRLTVFSPAKPISFSTAPAAVKALDERFATD